MVFFIALASFGLFENLKFLHDCVNYIISPQNYIYSSNVDLHMHINKNYTTIP